MPLRSLAPNRRAAARRLGLGVAVVLLLAAGCGPRPTGFDGFWWASPAANGGRGLWLAVGQGASGRVWTVAAFVFHFAHVQTMAYCQFHWQQTGTSVAYTGKPDAIEADLSVAASQVTVAKGIGTFTWTMSQTFDDRAKQAWLSDHPNADPNLKITAALTATGTLPDPDTLDLHAEAVGTDATTGKTLADERSDWRLERLGQCTLDTM